MPSVPVEIDVSEVVPFAGASMRVRGWVHAPPAPVASSDRDATVIVMCCLAGGTCSTPYFDLQVDGLTGYSMAERLAGHGLVTIAIDHLGVGASSTVDDIFLLTPHAVSAINDFAFRSVLTQLAEGTLPLPGWQGAVAPRPIGLGHSMGGMLIGVQQARHRTFDAVAVLGHGGDGMPAVLSPAEAKIDRPLDDAIEQVVALARARFSEPSVVERRRPVPGSFLADDVPQSVRAAFLGQQTSLLFTCGLTSMLPGITDRQKAAIDVPVFLAFGDRDLTSDYAGSLARYTGTNDITLFVVPGSAHCHNQASNRVLLWDRVASWAIGVVTLTDGASRSLQEA